MLTVIGHYVTYTIKLFVTSFEIENVRVLDLAAFVAMSFSRRCIQSYTGQVKQGQKMHFNIKITEV